jgi:hypothetical protein
MSLSRHSPSLGRRSAVRDLLLRAAGRGGTYDYTKFIALHEGKDVHEVAGEAYLKQAPHFVHESYPGKESERGTTRLRDRPSAFHSFSVGAAGHVY